MWLKKFQVTDVDGMVTENHIQNNVQVALAVDVIFLQFNWKYFR